MKKYAITTVSGDGSGDAVIVEAKEFFVSENGTLLLRAGSMENVAAFAQNGWTSIVEKKDDASA